MSYFPTWQAKILNNNCQKIIIEPQISVFLFVSYSWGIFKQFWHLLGISKK